MIAGPRNISTAMMYSFAQRNDCQVIDEPYYGHYLKETGINHPGRKETLDNLSDAHEIIHQEIIRDNTNDLLFLKNMGHHIRNIPFEYLLNYENFFLIRNPKKIINSFNKIISEMTIHDIGLKDQYQQLNYLLVQNLTPVVIDSDTILSNPKKYLSKLCLKLNIPFNLSMLSWIAGPKQEDGPWAKYWYTSLHKSTGFNPPDNSEITLDDKYESLLTEAMMFYEELEKFEIT